MENSRARELLERLIHERRENYDALSRLIGRNPSYIQQYIKRGTPRKLSETDRRTLARYFGVDEQLLGGPADTPSTAIAGRNKNRARMVLVPHYALGASAGAGSLDHTERPAGRMAFDDQWLRAMGANTAGRSKTRKSGE